MRHASHDVVFSRKGWDTQKLKALLAEKEAVIHAPDATDEPRNVRMDVVHAIALRRLIEKKQRGDSLSPPLEIHGIRIGPFVLLGSPFEVFQAIKNEVKDQAKSPIPLVMGVTNDTVGYAPDHTAAARGGYAADIVPIMCGSLPYANIHDELVQALLALDGDLCEAE